MRSAGITIIGVIVLGIYLCNISTEAQVSPLSLSIETDTPSVKLGDEIPIKILLKNNTDQSIRLSKVGTEGDGSFEYTVDVERDDHTVVAKKYVEKLRRKEVQPAIPPPGSVLFFTIEPGETDKDSIYISNRYEFDKPGKYLVQIERALPDDLGGGYQVEHHYGNGDPIDCIPSVGGRDAGRDPQEARGSGQDSSAGRSLTMYLWMVADRH